MKILSTVFSITNFILFLISSNLFAQTPPGFPAQPMIVHGEVLVSGKNVGVGAVVEARAGSTTVAKTQVSNQFGFSSYVLEIKKSPKISSYQQITIFHGTNQAEGDLTWKEGGSAIKDILTRSTVRNRATIKNATVAKDTSGWQLQCEFDPLQQEDITPESIKYHVRWYFTANEGGQEEVEPKLIMESTVASLDQKQTFSLEAGTIPDLTGFLHLVVTPILNNGELGPSAVKKIKTELKEAEL